MRSRATTAPSPPPSRAGRTRAADAGVLRLARAAAALAEALADGTVLGAFALTEPDTAPTRLARDHRDAHRRRLVAQRHEEVDWQRRLRRHHLRVGPRRERRRRRPRQRALLPRRAGHPRLHGHHHHRKGVAARHPPGSHRDGRTCVFPRMPLLPGTHIQGRIRRPLRHAFGVAWSALGHATACYEIARTYATERMQFGKPLARFQMVQERLAVDARRAHRDAAVLRRLADLESSGGLRPLRRHWRIHTNQGGRAPGRRDRPRSAGR